VPKDPTKRYIPCPVEPFTVRALAYAVELNKAMRRLRRAMRRCKHCISADDCPVLGAFNQQFNIVLDEIVKEWALDDQRPEQPG
jgi:hypothetical protein